VPVRILALAFVVAQVMPCGECVFDGNFEHYGPFGGRMDKGEAALNG
jgi:hypothetical protein